MKKFWIAAVAVLLLALFLFCVLFPMQAERRALGNETAQEV